MKIARSTFTLFAFFLLPVARGQEVIFFQDSNNPGYYDTGLAFPTAPSSLEQAGPSGDKIPVDYQTVFSGNNSLRLRWTSRDGGDWSALVIAPGFPFQDISTSDTLSFWAYSPEGLGAGTWPVISLEGAPGATKSNPYILDPYAGILPPKQWTQVKVPLTVFFDDPSQTNINFQQIKAVIFSQGFSDGVSHTLYIDEVKTYAGATSPPDPPTNLRAKGYDSHIELRWELSPSAAGGYRIYRSLDDGATFSPLRSVPAGDSLFIDFLRPLGTNVEATYRITALNGGLESVSTETAAAMIAEVDDQALLTMVQEYTFRYFWDFGHPVSGLSRERNTSGDIVTTGGTGFGVMALIVGIERGFITRKQGLQRILQMVTFLETCDRFHGAFPHWLNGGTGKVVPFSQLDNGGDIVETAFLFEGLLCARQYFDGEAASETTLRQKITTLWEAIEWNWYRKQNENVIYWHWSPDYNFAINLPVRGWNETMMVYLLGIASPTQGVPASLWQNGWAGSNYLNGNTYFGIELPLGYGTGGPLFFTHYSFLGFDPRYKRDEYTSYWVQNRNQTLINRAWCIENPRNHTGYSENCWGLTASDDPLVGYLAHEPSSNTDNGTITPTAALSSMPYTTHESMAALKYFYRELGARLWGPMGFYDAFHLGLNWYAPSYLAIDQGPIIGMIENQRSGLLWNLFMKDPEILDAVERIGFVPDSIPTGTPHLLTPDLDAALYPNPATDHARLELTLRRATTATIELMDATGRTATATQYLGQLSPGQHQIPLNLNGLPRGIYFLKLTTRFGKWTSRIVKN